MPTATKSTLTERGEVAFREGATGQRREAILIREGWGSSGYYSYEVLERDMPKAFPVGTHMYLDHPTVKEDEERPERTVRDLVGVTVSSPRMAGIDSVAEVEIFPHWVPVIDAMAEHIGLSIRAYGEIEEGDAGGKHGPIVQGLHMGESIDYVTKAGAGGQLGALIESARKDPEQLRIEADRAQSQPDWLKPFITEAAERLGIPDPFKDSGSGRETKEGEMPELKEELSEAQSKVRQLEETVSKRDTELKEAQEEASTQKDRADRAEDKLLQQEAARVVAGVISETEGLPKKAAARVLEACMRSDLPTDSDGHLDKDALKERAASKAKEEIDYLNGVTGGSGEVRGFGESGGGNDNEGTDEKELAEALGSYLDLPEDVAKHAAKGR